MAERVLKKYKTFKTAAEISAFLYFYMWRFLFPGLSKAPRPAYFVGGRKRYGRFLWSGLRRDGEAPLLSEAYQFISPQNGWERKWGIKDATLSSRPSRPGSVAERIRR
jgi:hypothetical protein